MARLLRQLVEASQLQAVAEPWIARTRNHRVWTTSGDCQSLPGALRGQDSQDEDSLREGSRGVGLAFPQGRLSSTVADVAQLTPTSLGDAFQLAPVPQLWVILLSFPSCDLEERRASVCSTSSCELEWFLGDAYQLAGNSATELRS